MDVRKLGQGVRGVLRKMSGGQTAAKKSWSNSSSQMEMESESLLPISKDSLPTLSEQAGKLNLSWTSPSIESVSSPVSNGSEPEVEVRYHLHPDGSRQRVTPEEHDVTVDPEPFREKHRECTLVIHFATFGNEEQALERSARIVGHLEMQGTEIVQATHNDIHIQGLRDG